VAEAAATTDTPTVGPAASVTVAYAPLVRAAAAALVPGKRFVKVRLDAPTSAGLNRPAPLGVAAGGQTLAAAGVVAPVPARAVSAAVAAPGPIAGPDFDTPARAPAPTAAPARKRVFRRDPTP
jgi:hypothetical protein